MTIRTSGAISLDDIVAEFGGTTPHSLSEYYAGGASVPAGTTRDFPANSDGRGVNAAVPSSGTIALADFYGTTAVVVSALQDVSDTGIRYNGNSGSGTFLRMRAINAYEHCVHNRSLYTNMAFTTTSFNWATGYTATVVAYISNTTGTYSYNSVMGATISVPSSYVGNASGGGGTHVARCDGTYGGSTYSAVATANWTSTSILKSS